MLRAKGFDCRVEPPGLRRTALPCQGGKFQIPGRCGRHAAPAEEERIHVLHQNQLKNRCHAAVFAGADRASPARHPSRSSTKATWHGWLSSRCSYLFSGAKSVAQALAGGFLAGILQLFPLLIWMPPVLAGYGGLPEALAWIAYGLMVCNAGMLSGSGLCRDEVPDEALRRILFSLIPARLGGFGIRSERFTVRRIPLAAGRLLTVRLAGPHPDCGPRGSLWDFFPDSVCEYRRMPGPVYGRHAGLRSGRPWLRAGIMVLGCLVVRRDFPAALGRVQAGLSGRHAPGKPRYR